MSHIILTRTAKASAPARKGRALQRSVTFATLCVVGLGLAACKHDLAGPQVAGWTLVDPSQRHPILVSEKPETVALRVPRGSQGLSPQQRARVLEFAERFRSRDNGSSRLVIAAPSGAPNESDAVAAVQDIRTLLAERGFSESSIHVEAYAEDSDPQPPIRVSFMSYTAQGPDCGTWATNVARQPDNMNYGNFGCATQHNIAAQIANPADLLGPRASTPRASGRRATVWEKYQKGETTNTQKDADEKISTKNSN